MFQDFHSLFHSLLITYNIAASYEEENSTQTQERHGKVDAVLVLIVPGIGIGTGKTGKKAFTRSVLDISPHSPNVSLPSGA